MSAKFSVSKYKDGIYFDICLIKCTKPIILDFNKFNEAICQFVLKLCDYSPEINTPVSEKDNRALITTLISDEQELKLQSLYKPDYYEYSDVFDKQYINGTLLPEYTYIVQKNAEQYNFITSSGSDIQNVTASSKSELDNFYDMLNACTFDKMSDYIPLFFDTLAKCRFPLVTFKRHAVELLRCIYNKIEKNIRTANTKLRKAAQKSCQ